MEDKEILQRKLDDLKTEHRELDELIGQIIGNPPFDQLYVQRLKKRKLSLKDQITKVESVLMPDIIA